MTDKTIQRKCNMLYRCSFCPRDAEQDDGTVIYVKGKVTMRNLSNWTSLPICQKCWEASNK